MKQIKNEIIDHIMKKDTDAIDIFGSLKRSTDQGLILEVCRTDQHRNINLLFYIFISINVYIF